MLKLTFVAVKPGTVIEVADAEYAGRLVAAGMVEADDGRQTTDDGGQSSDDLGPSATQVGPGPRAKKRKTG